MWSVHVYIVHSLRQLYAALPKVMHRKSLADACLTIGHDNVLLRALTHVSVRMCTTIC